MLQIRHPPSRADLDALPETARGEIIDGVLYTFPRPRALHQRITMKIVGKLDGPYDEGDGGPGGWVLLPEPGIELPRAPEFSPDVAGWRAERWQDPGSGTIRIVPDWVVEVLSPSTRRHDWIVKRPFYASIGIEWMWLVDSESRSVLVSHLENGVWVDVAVHAGEERACLAPFLDVELDLGRWWGGPVDR